MQLIQLFLISEIFHKVKPSMLYKTCTSENITFYSTQLHFTVVYAHNNYTYAKMHVVYLEGMQLNI